MINAETFEWLDEHENAFQALKEAIATATELAFPQFDKPFKISADASDFALGAVITQDQLYEGHIVDRPIAFASRSLTPTESKYSTFEKEALALVFATQQFRHYILGNKVTFLSDHRPLQWLRSTRADPKKQSSRRIQRWQLWLEQFNFDIKYQRGTQQFIADALSRAPVAVPELDDYISAVSAKIDDLFPPTVNVIDLAANCKIETDSLHQLQLDDVSFGNILRQLATRPRHRPEVPEEASREIKRFRDKFRHIVKRNGVWHLRARNGRLLVLLPSALRAEVMYHFHSASSSAHLGLYSTLNRIRQSFFWPSMGNQVGQFVLAWEPCCKAKAQNIRTRAPLTPIETKAPFEIIGCDILDLPTTSNGFSAVLVVTDLFTKWCEAYPLRQSTAEEVSTHLMDFVSRYGMPETILTDQGSQFESNVLDSLYERLGIRKIRTAPYMPRTDGAAERLNRSIIQMLRPVTDDRRAEWDSVLSAILFAYRSTPHSSTGFSPYELLFGRPPVLPGHLIIADILRARQPSLHIPALRQHLQDQWIEANRNLDAARQRQKDYYDRFTNERRFRLNDLVWLQAPPRTAKLLPRFLGPYIITRVLPNGVNYQIRLARNDNAVPTIVNIEKLKPALQREEWMERVDITDVLPQPPRRSERPVQPRNDSRFGIGEPANNEQMRQAGLRCILINEHNFPMIVYLFALFAFSLSLIFDWLYHTSHCQ